MSASRNGRRAGAPRSMRLIDGVIGDAELLGVVDDLADERGWTSTYAIQIQLGERPEEFRKVSEGEIPRSGVGPRLSWLVRYGWLERSSERIRVESGDPRGWRWSQSWRLTPMGHLLLDDADLSRAVQNALERLNPAQRLRVTREMAEVGGHSAPEIRNALRRQWVRSLGH